MQKDTRNIRNQILFSFFYKINLILFLFLSNKLVNNQLASNTYVKINLILTVDFILEIPKIICLHFDFQVLQWYFGEYVTLKLSSLLGVLSNIY